MKFICGGKIIRKIRDLFVKKITKESVTDYIENQLNLELDHLSSADSSYYKLGDIYIRVSDHLQNKVKSCIGVSVVEGSAIINVFNKVITCTSMKDIKFFLWSFVSFYGSDNINSIQETAFEIFRKQHYEDVKTIDKFRKNAQTYADKSSDLLNKNKNLEKKVTDLNNQIVNLHKEIKYLKNVNSKPNVKKKSGNNLANTKNKLKESEGICEDLVNIILDVSKYMGQFPEELQTRILNIIGDYYN